MNRIPRRLFSAEFKAEAIKLVNQQSLTLAEAARRLDIATKSLRKWIAQAQQGALKLSLGAHKLSAAPTGHTQEEIQGHNRLQACAAHSVQSAGSPVQSNQRSQLGLGDGYYLHFC